MLGRRAHQEKHESKIRRARRRVARGPHAASALLPRPNTDGGHRYVRRSRRARFGRSPAAAARDAPA